MRGTFPGYLFLLDYVVKNSIFAEPIFGDMIKKIIIRILAVVMLIAFIAIVGVQWFWIKYSMKESEIRFSSKVHSALDRVVNRIEDINNVRYVNQMTERLKAFE